MPNLHPLLVHLPIALLTCSFLLDVMGILLKNQDLQKSGWWTLVCGMVGLIAAIVTGLQAKGSVYIDASAAEHFQTHEQIGFFLAATYSMLCLWRIANRTNLPRKAEWAFVAIALLGVVGVWIGAWYGGELVYHFGIGVQGK